MKANSVDVYTKPQIDTSFDSKANSADVYTKAESNTLLNSKQKYNSRWWI